MSVVETCLYNLYIVLSDGWFLGELVAKEIGNEVKVAVKEPSKMPQRYHVAALQNSFVVHS